MIWANQFNCYKIVQKSILNSNSSNDNIPKTYGLANMAGTVKPTTTRKNNHEKKFHENVLSTQAMISKNRYTKNDGFRPQ